MSIIEPIVLSSAPTLVDLLRYRAEIAPNQTAYSFLHDGDVAETGFTYQELDRQARRIAAWLQQEKLCGERVLLVYPQGLNYIAAFLGCLYAGSIAVPVYPPRLNRHLQRIAVVVKDCYPSVALTSQTLLSRIETAAAQEPGLTSLRWCAVEEIDEELAERWIPPRINQQTLAFLQYTSGSTAEPKGVMVSHGNLTCNEKMIQHAFGVTQESVIVGWLPLFHDMGLIGNVLQALWAGARCVLLSPGSFLRRPFNWLRAITRYKATISGGPNFAYELCTARITAEEQAALDLSSWCIAFNGSEPVRAQTMALFSAKFAACGFNAKAFFPCYGLAEATLFVAGKSNAGPLTVPVHSDSLARHEFAIADETGDQTQLLVSSGAAGIKEKVAIIDPETLQPCPPGKIAEVWVAGDNIACGYWNQPETSKAVFQAFTAENEGPFLRTGDLGCLMDRELFITGRIKDLLIVRGRNHYPQDLEFTVACSHPAFAGNAGAAFAVDIGGTTQPILVQEVTITSESASLEELLRTAVQAIAEEHEIQMHTVALVEPGSLPKTSSGKIRRQECRRQFLHSELRILATTSPCIPATLEQTGKGLSTADNEDQARIEIEAKLLAIAAEILQLSCEKIDVKTPLSAYGLDSLQTAELNNSVARTWNIELALEDLPMTPTISSLAALLQSMLDRGARTALGGIEPGRAQTQWPLSYGQRAMVYLYKLAPQAAAYHIPLALRLQGSLDNTALQFAIDALVRRHECLHSVFVSEGQEMVQRLVELSVSPFRFENAEGWANQHMQTRLTSEASAPFDLEKGPLFRAVLFRISSEEHVLLLVFHHIITDFTSLTLLFEEFRQLYAGWRKNRDCELPVWPYRYADFVQWQQEMLQTERGKKLRDFWKQQLGGGLPVLKLPTDHPRPPVQTYRGATFNFKIDDVTTSGIHRLARAREATLYTVVLSAFMVFLRRYSSQTEIVLGSPVSGRTRSCWSGLPGYLINQIVFRAEAPGQENFSDFLNRIRDLVAAGLAHQDYPLALVAEDLQPERDPAYPALFQVMFSLQKSAPGHDDNIVALALGEPGYPVEFDNLMMDSFARNHDTTQLDLTLAMAQIGGGLAASFQYNADLFDHSTLVRMAGHFQNLLQDIVARIQCRLDELQLMSPEEYRQIILEWNNTERPYSRETRIHDLFSARAIELAESVAAIGGGQELTFSELERKSNQLAHHLRAKGVGQETIVGLCMERSAELLAAIIGILKAGAAYLPLDPLLPDERIAYMLGDAGVRIVVSQQSLSGRLQGYTAEVISFDSDAELAQQSIQPLLPIGSSGDLAYVMYTSGSTGKPKGVMVTHRSVVNFFHAMDERISCSPRDTLLAVTAISFDISVLELLWTLTRGAKVVLADPLTVSAHVAPIRNSARQMDYSLFYFASADEERSDNKYELLLQGAKYADKNGFTAVWTPERHFHPFGGLYPNPAVTGAAVAAVTERVHIRAGSVVLPLHNVIRVAEEWSVLDNLSGGRTGLAFASGWHADDFVFAPQNYRNRKEIMFQGIETFVKLWRGESVRVQSGSGKEIEIRIFPKPKQEQPSLWITAAGTPETFVRAGQIGANILTHLLGQTVEEVAQKISLYRDSRQKHGHDPDSGKVTLMLHTFLGTDREKVKDQVRAPFTRYLSSSVDLIRNLVKSANLPLNFENMSAKDMDDLMAFAFERYFETSALFGTMQSCQLMIEKLEAIGVNEIACLIDFGVENRAALQSLSYVSALKNPAAPQPRHAPRSLEQLARTYQPTLMQCTPAVMKMLSASSGSLMALRSVRTLMLGGESLPPALAREIKQTLPCRLVNMYGPTETTIWSSTAEIMSATDSIHIGKPVANTTMYILDSDSSTPVPIGVPGELYIGGDGVTRGYLNRPDLTAERFLPDPFAMTAGFRLYRTGDLARYLPDGNIELLGRNDNQVKIRGVRIELDEIQSTLCEHPAVTQAVLIASKEGDEKRLIAYIVPTPERPPTIADLRNFLKARLPEAMVPSSYMFLPRLPLTSSGKVDRRLLPQPNQDRAQLSTRFLPPTTEYEVAISSIWKRVLNLDTIGIDDNFFDLGGHSLRLVQVHGELIRDLRLDIPLVKLLEYPTVRMLSSYLTSGMTENSERKRADRAVSQQAAILRQQKNVMARRTIPA